MLYADLTQALAILATENDSTGIYTFVNSPDFGAFLPRVTEAAEGRCYREACPLAMRTANSTAAFTANSRTLALSAFSQQPVVVEGIAAIMPVGQQPSAGRRWPYRQVSLDFIDTIWPQEAMVAAPSAAYPELYWAMKDAQTIVVAPTPDAAYVVEGTGTFRQTPLSASNVQTYLTIFYPDLFLKACMIEVAGYQREFGAQAEDPKLALSWMAQYESAKASALLEEDRRRGQGFHLAVDRTHQAKQTSRSETPA